MTGGSFRLETKDSQVASVEPLSKAQVEFLEFCKEFGYGKFEVEVINGEPKFARDLRPEKKFGK